MAMMWVRRSPVNFAASPTALLEMRGMWQSMHCTPSARCGALFVWNSALLPVAVLAGRPGRLYAGLSELHDA